jgi:hypothetical protein
VVLSGFFPWWVALAAVLFPVASLLGGVLSWLADGKPSAARQRREALLSVFCASLGLVAMIVMVLIGFDLHTKLGPYGTSLIGDAAGGLWLMFAGLLLILVGVVLRSVPLLRRGS